MLFTPAQLLIVGILATLLTSLLTWVLQKAVPWFVAAIWKKPVTIDLNRFVKTIIVGVVALGLAWWWYPASLPAWPVFTGTFLNWVQQILDWLPLLGAALSPYFGAAVAIYNLLLGYITDPDRRAKFVDYILELLGIKQPEPIGPDSK